MIPGKQNASCFVSKQVTSNWMSHCKAWLDFLEQPISQCSLVCLSLWSFICEGYPNETETLHRHLASVCVWLLSSNRRCCFSCLAFISEAQLWLCKSGRSKLPGVIAGSRSVSALSEVEWRRFSTHHHLTTVQPPWLQIITSAMCDVWEVYCVSVFIPWLLSYQYFQYPPSFSPFYRQSIRYEVIYHQLNTHRVLSFWLQYRHRTDLNLLTQFSPRKVKK